MILKTFAYKIVNFLNIIITIIYELRLKCNLMPGRLNGKSQKCFRKYLWNMNYILGLKNFSQKWDNTFHMVPNGGDFIG